MPRELDSPRGNPLTSEPARDTEPERDLKNENFSATPTDGPNEPIKDLARPLVSDPVKDNEPTRVLYSEIRSVRPKDQPREPVKALARPLISEAARESEPASDSASPLA